MDRSPSLRKDFAWILVGNSVYAASQWGIVMALAKLSSVTAMGQLALGMAVTAPIFLFTNLNLRLVLATDGGHQYAFRAYLRLRLLTTASALVLASAIALGGGYRPETATFIGLVGALKAIESISDLYYGLQQLQQRMQRVAVSMILRGVCSLALFTGVLMMGGTPEMAVAAIGAVWLAVLLGYDTTRSGPEPSPARPDTPHRTVARMVKLSLPLGLAAMLLSFNTNIPRYFLERRWGERDLGIYSALAFFVVAGSVLMNALCQSAMTRLANFYREGRREEFWRLLKRLAGLAAGIGGFGVALSAMAGHDLLILLYRSEYAEHASVLVLLMVGGTVQYFGSCFGVAITAMRLFRVQMWIHAVTTVVTLACAWPLVRTWGLAGAACAGIIGSACATLPYAVLTYRKLKAWQ